MEAKTLHIYPSYDEFSYHRGVTVFTSRRQHIQYTERHFSYIKCRVYTVFSLRTKEYAKALYLKAFIYSLKGLCQEMEKFFGWP